MPIGAFITTEDVWNRAFGGMEKALLHTSTFGGNTLACAAGIAAINAIVENSLTQNAQEMGEYLLKGLRELKGRYPIIKDVRGRGLMIGLELNTPQGGLLNMVTGGCSRQFIQRIRRSNGCRELLNKHQIITAYTLNNPNVIRLEPPLIIKREDIDTLLNALEDILSKNKGLFSLTLSTVKTATSSLFSK